MAAITYSSMLVGLALLVLYVLNNPAKSDPRYSIPVVTLSGSTPLIPTPLRIEPTATRWTRGRYVSSNEVTEDVQPESTLDVIAVADGGDSVSPTSTLGIKLLPYVPTPTASQTRPSPTARYAPTRPVRPGVIYVTVVHPVIVRETQVIVIESAPVVSTVIVIVTPTPSPTSTPSPTLSPTSTPSETVTFTPAPSPTIEPTQELTPEITVFP